SFADVLKWSMRLGLIDAPAAARLAKECEEHPREAAASLKKIRELRESLWHLFAVPGSKAIGRLRIVTKDLPLPRLRPDQTSGVVIEPGRDLCGWLIAAVYGSALELLILEDP